MLVSTAVTVLFHHHIHNLVTPMPSKRSYVVKIYLRNFQVILECSLRWMQTAYASKNETFLIVWQLLSLFTVFVHCHEALFSSICREILHTATLMLDTFNLPPFTGWRRKKVKKQKQWCLKRRLEKTHISRNCNRTCCNRTAAPNLSHRHEIHYFCWQKNPYHPAPIWLKLDCKWYHLARMEVT